MNICPICQKDMSVCDDDEGILDKHILDKNFKYCPHCGSLLRMKLNTWTIPVFLAFGFCCSNFKTHWIFSVLTIVFLVLLFICYSKSKYVPYEGWEF